MHIENQYSFYLNKWIKYCSKEKACDYRDKIQKLIDGEGLTGKICVDITDYNDGSYGIYLRAGGKLGYIDSRADVFILYCDMNRKMNYILDAVGISDKIES
jgi:hypothetical protein